MGVAIKATGTSNGTDTGSIVTHAGRAVRAAIDNAGIGSDQVNVLINTCVYRDQNTMEPAIGALIQKEAGIGLEYGPTDPRTFSFDLMNGACGVLNAIQVASSLLLTDSAEHVVIVSGDTHPSMTGTQAPQDFPYGTSSAALVLVRTDDESGFGPLHTELGSGTPAVQGYVDGTAIGTNGRNMMIVEREDDFEDRLLATAVSAAQAALGGANVDHGRTLLLSSVPTAQFPTKLAAELGVAAPDSGLLGSYDRDPHTAALPLSFHESVKAGALDSYDHVLFVAAGAGPSAAASLYRLPTGTVSA